MGHNHNRSHSHNSSSNIKVAFFLNLFFTILEIIGGLWTNSMSILSDALHDLGDSFSLGIAWYFEGYSKKGPDEKFTYGYSRFSLLGAMINSIILIGGSIFILTRAIPRLIVPEPINAKGMLAFAIIGIIINGLAVIRLRKGNSLNERVVSWHLFEDVLGWVAVLVVSIVLLFRDIPILDPILSIIITLYILYNVFKNLREIMNVFLQRVPDQFSIIKIEKEIAEKTDAILAHHTHIWSLEGDKHILSTHVVIEENSNQQEIANIKEQVKKLINEKGIKHVTVEIEFKNEECDSKDCY